MGVRSLTDTWTLGGRRIENRVVLAPLAGIGNWFVRLQAKRFGAGLVVSEMVSSFGLAYGNERTVREFLRIHPDEHPVSVQLFGHDPAIMREAASMAAAAGADLVDLNMGCPVPKVCKTGAGSALLSHPDKGVALARAAGEGSGLPVTVKLRPGRLPGERDGLELALRLGGGGVGGGAGGGWGGRAWPPPPPTPATPPSSTRACRTTGWPPSWWSASRCR